MIITFVACDICVACEVHVVTDFAFFLQIIRIISSSED